MFPYQDITLTEAAGMDSTISTSSNDSNPAFPTKILGTNSESTPMV